MRVFALSAQDFAMTNGCTAVAYAVNATCTIAVSFAPLAAGSRTATVTVTDDAANSPQIINLGGSSAPAATVGAAPSGSTSAAVSAGQTAQYNLQITPGPGYIGTISLAYNGAPTGAAIQGPPTLQISNGNPVPFTVMLTTSGAAATLPFSGAPRSTPSSGPLLMLTLYGGVLLLLLVLRGAKIKAIQRPRRPVFGSVFAAMAMSLVFAAAGCGGGSTSVAAPPPQSTPIVTPQGAYMITITPSATSASGKPLQLQAIQLTLTVN